MSDSSDMVSSDEGSVKHDISDREKAPKKSMKRPIESDEDDSEIESSDESDDQSNRRPKMGKRMPKPEPKKRPGGASQFFVDEAIDNDDSEEDDDYDDEDNDLLDERDERLQADEALNNLDDHRAHDTARIHGTQDDMEKYYMEKYVNDAESESSSVPISAPTTSYRTTRTEVLAETERSNPTVKDPSIWLVKVRHGEEQNAVRHVIRKAVKSAMKGQPLQIKSVVSPDAVKGWIYVEAWKENHVITAIEEIHCLFMGIHHHKLICRKEMPDILRVGSGGSKRELKENTWVRVKRGEYKDDLAWVDYIDTTSNAINLKLVPRIDYTKLRGYQRDRTSIHHRKSRTRSTQKLFDDEHIRSIGGEVTTDGDFLLFENKRYRAGFLYKEFKADFIKVDDVQPTLHELEMFEDNVEDIRLTKTSVLEKEIKENRLMIGDHVIVIEGELVGLEGRVVTMHRESGRVTITPKHNELNEPLEFPAHELRKHFKEGDHVKVISGKYTGDTGLVVQVTLESGKAPHAVVISDVSTDEMQVLTKDIKICKEVSAGVDSIGRFSFGDLVEIDSTMVGVIVRLEKEYLHILNQYGKVQKFKHAMISRRRKNGRAMALDSDKNALQTREVVKVIDGQYKGREAEIKHIFRQFLFLYSRKIMENGGLFVARARHCQLVGGGKGVILGETPNFPGIMMSPRLLSSPSHPSQGSTITPSGQSPRINGPNVNKGAHIQQSLRDKQLMNKTVKVVSGAYKGYVGIVKDATSVAVRLELHSSVVKINVDKGNIQVVDNSGKTSGRSSTYTLTGGKTPMVGADGSKTPMYAEGTDTTRTPMYESGKTPNPYQDGSRTPLYGAVTPRQDGGMSTWDPNITNTPAAIRDSSDYSYDDQNIGPHTPGNLSHGHTNYEASPIQSPLADHGNASEHLRATPSSRSYPHTPIGGMTPQATLSYQSPFSAFGQDAPAASPGASFSVQSPMQSSQSGMSESRSPVYSASPVGSYHPSPMAPVASPGSGYMAAPSPFAAYSPAGSGTGSSTYSPSSLQPGSASNQYMMPGDMTDWYTTDIWVTIKPSFDQAELHGKQGIIRTVTVNLCAVYVPSLDKVITIDGIHLLQVTPMKDDKVKVLTDDDREQLGTLISIDGYDGIVRMDQDKQLKILQLRYLGKLADSSDTA